MVDDNSKHKKAKGVNKNNVATISHNEYKDVFWIKNVSGIQWIGSKVKIIELELMKSTKFHCLALMTKYICKTRDMNGLALGCES